MSQLSAVASASFARSSPRCQLWTSLPRFPSGFSRLWSGPATKPSSEIDMWQVVSGTANLLGECDVHSGRALGDMAGVLQAGGTSIPEGTGLFLVRTEGDRVALGAGRA